MVVVIVRHALRPSRLPCSLLRPFCTVLVSPGVGHAVSQLLTYINAPQGLIDEAKYLDKMYVPTRYQNAWLRRRRTSTTLGLG